jgi:hypothetical protein
MITVLLIIVVLILLLYYGSSRSKFESDRCGGMCFSIDGTALDDVSACCDCLSTGKYITKSPSYELKYRKCMCNYGYNDFCYPLDMPDLLLSQ